MSPDPAAPFPAPLPTSEHVEPEPIAAWRAGMARLDPAAPPPGYRTGEWERVCRNARAFLDRHAVEAARCGWGTLDLWGLDAVAGGSCLDLCGALLVPFRHFPSVVTAEAVAFGPLRFYRRPVPPGVLPVWDVPELSPS